MGLPSILCSMLSMKMIDKSLFTTQSSFFLFVRKVSFWSNANLAISHKNKAFLIILSFFLLLSFGRFYFITKCYALIIPRKKITSKTNHLYTHNLFAEIFHSVLLQVSLLLTFTWLLWSYCLNEKRKKIWTWTDWRMWLNGLTDQIDSGPYIMFRLSSIPHKKNFCDRTSKINWETKKFLHATKKLQKKQKRTLHSSSPL